MVEDKSVAQVGNTLWSWFIVLIVLGTLLRVGLWFVYEPIEYSDTGAYFRLAAGLEDLTLSGYDGSRVPGYPFFIALVGMDAYVIWAAQMALGLLTSMLMFWLAWETLGSPVLSFLIGGLQAVFPATILFEANLLTETLTIFLISLIVVLIAVFRRIESHLLKYVLVCLLGISASLVGLVRPIFFPLTLWLLPFLWLFSGADLKHRLSTIGLYALFPLIMQGGWLFYMKTHYHVISPTAIGGYSMVQHSGEFFEALPDEYATIRDVYIEYRDAQIAARGSQNNAIWQAVPALTEASGLSFYELSRTLGMLSWRLIREHPAGYLVNVAEGWVWFWKAPVYWRPDLIKSEIFRQVLHFSAQLGRGLALVANAGFLVISAALLFCRKVRDWVKIDPMLVLVGGFIWWTSILQSLFEHGDNPRFLVPLQMILIYFVVRCIVGLRRSLVDKR
jgi:hypothetical protein